jgi:hypothetical protein
VLLFYNLRHLHCYLSVVSLHKLHLFGGYSRITDIENRQIAGVRVSLSIEDTDHHAILESFRSSFEVGDLKFAQLLSADGHGVILHIHWN